LGIRYFGFGGCSLLDFCPLALVEGAQSVHTFIMTLKNTSFLALVGMVLVTILLIGNLITDVSGVARGLIPAMKLLTSFIYAFAGLSVVVFLYAFHKAQS
jgi:hypothetical protein